MGKSPIRGKAFSPGIAVAKVWRTSPKGLAPPKHNILPHDTEQELRRLRNALEQSVVQLKSIQNRLSRFQDQDQIDILESHLLLLRDPLWHQHLEQTLRTESINTEWALEKTLAHFKTQLVEQSHPQFQERLYDIEAVAERLMHNLIGQAQSEWREIPPGRWMILAENLSPAEIATLPKDRVIAFATVKGGPTSHSLIIARSLNLPALVGIPLQDFQAIASHTPCILDGFEGHLLLEPTPAQIQKCDTLLKKHQALAALLLKESHHPAITKEGEHVPIEANIEWIDEIPVALNHGAEGIGMVRTEYLYLGKTAQPSEEDQLQIYRNILKQMQGRPVTIRTVDLPEPEWLGPPQQNPALGLRGLRRGLKEPELLRPQLRALLQASQAGPLRILFPMVTSLEEFRKVKAIVLSLCEELKLRPVPLGAMIEVPSAALTADWLAQEADFFAIGTNDLMQYTLAIDRTNEQLTQMYSPYHPALLRFLKTIVEAAHQAKIPVSLCGELATDPQFIPILLGSGIDSLSMTPLAIPSAKKLIRQLSREKCRTIFQQLLTFKTAQEVETHLKAALGNSLDTLYGPR